MRGDAFIGFMKKLNPDRLRIARPSMSEWEYFFVNDPNQDYTLTMELWFGDEQIAIVRKSVEGLSLDLYGSGSRTIAISLDWIIEKLKEARPRSPAASPLDRSEIWFSGRRVAEVEGFAGDLAIRLYGSGTRPVLVSHDWLTEGLLAAREELSKPGTT